MATAMAIFPSWSDVGFITSLAGALTFPVNVGGWGHLQEAAGARPRHPQNCLPEKLNRS